MMITATWTKLDDGTWGLRCKGAVAVGDIVLVTKNSGQKTSETVGDIVRRDTGETLTKVGPKKKKVPRELFRSVQVCPEDFDSDIDYAVSVQSASWSDRAEYGSPF
jgi:hypothetical protein